MNQITQEEIVSIGNLEILAKQVVEGFITGLHKSPFHGFSVEFAEHRLYNSGESVKNVDWKLFARTDKMFTKRFEEETNLRCQLLIDVSASMFYPEQSLNKFQFSALTSAAIIHLLKKQRDAFGLTLFAEEIEWQTPAKSTLVHERFLYHQLETYLQSPQRDKKTNLADCLHQIAESIPKRSLIVLFSDLFENHRDDSDVNAIFSALQHLRYNKHEVIVFNVLQRKQELEFDFENRPYHFIDSETGDQLKLNPQQYAQEYRNAMESFKKSLDLRCAQLHIDLVDAYLEDGFNPTLNAWLVKRNRLY
ncbi:DUF58 domain-containing protein [Pseudoxanthomonas sp. SGD-10]|nr:DUF58 domain-containing protein [Pseudoxanthomonas sp. SGD-10]